MPLMMQEMFDSRKLMFAKDTETAQTEWVAYGTDDETVAYAAFNAAIPETFPAQLAGGTLTRDNFNCWTLGGLFWRATAFYSPDTAPLFPAVGIVGAPTPIPGHLNPPGENTPLNGDYNFDFSGVIEHITQSKETTFATPGAPNNNGAIGVTGDGRVEGCDRVRPNFEWTRTVTFSSVTMAYLKSVSAMVGTTNNAIFYTWDVGTSIFLGGNCQIKDTFRAVVTFKFLSNPNLENLTVHPSLGAVPIKRGSEYLWVAYQNVPDATKLTQQPSAVYVERVCDPADWSQLRIGA